MRATSFGALLLAVCGLTSCGDDVDSSAEGSAACPAITLGHTGGKPTRTPPEPDELATAIAEGFCSTFVLTGAGEDVTVEPVLAADDSRCIARGLVDALGEARARQLGFTGPWNLLLFALRNPTIERAESEKIVDVFVDCSDHWELLLVTSVTEGASGISDESAGCVVERLDDREAREILIGEIDRAYDDPSQPGATPYPELVAPLVDAMDACLTDTELAGVDWN